MIKYVLMLVAMVAFSSCYGAERIAVGPTGDSVKLLDSVCTSKFAFGKVKREYHARLKAAVYFVHDKKETINGCWIEEDGQVVTLWDDGDIFPVPSSMFKPVGSGMYHQPGTRPGPGLWDASNEHPKVVQGYHIRHAYNECLKLDTPGGETFKNCMASKGFTL